MSHKTQETNTISYGQYTIFPTQQKDMAYNMVRQSCFVNMRSTSGGRIETVAKPNQKCIVEGLKRTINRK